MIRQIRLPAAMLAILVLAHKAEAQTFVDATSALGNVYNQFPSLSIFTEAGVMSGGAAAGDYDGDGWTDLLMTRADLQPVLYHNQGNGTFAEVSSSVSGIDMPAGSNGASWGDVNNDGHLDLYLTSIGSQLEAGSTNRNRMFINNGDGTFYEDGISRGVDVANTSLASANNFSSTFGDYDGDGYLDLMTTSWNDDGGTGTRLFKNQGASNPGYFTDVTNSAGVAMDHIQDERGDGTVEGGRSYAFSPRFSDLNGDGHVDLAVAGDFGTSALFWNNGDGTFTDGTVAAGVGLDENGMGSTIGDFNGDGNLDWFVTSIRDHRGSPVPDGNWGITGNKLYLNEGDGTFSEVASSVGDGSTPAPDDGGWGWGAAFLDYDNDGDLDLTHTNGFVAPPVAIEDIFNNDPTRLWRNNGDGTFSEVALAEGVIDDLSGKGLLTFDYDNDGDLDMFVVNNGAEPVLYRNDSANGNAWLQIELTGSVSNIDGIGALITVTPELGGSTQMWEVNAGSNFLAQSDMRAHFGLGDLEGLIDELTVEFPSGLSYTFNDVSPNSLYMIYEGTGEMVLVTAVIPEPSSMVLAGIAISAAIACGVRCRSNHGSCGARGTVPFSRRIGSFRKLSPTRHENCDSPL